MSATAIDIVAATSAERIEQVAALARRIWAEHYTPLIGPGQVAYMLDRFQSAPAIADQIDRGWAYYLAVDAGQAVGYLALVPDPVASSVQLSKIYVAPDRQGRGIGAAMVRFAVRRCAEWGAGELWLTVNRHNAGAIAFYQHRGFAITGPIVTDIGAGYIMDDYRMALGIDRSGVGDEQAWDGPGATEGMDGQGEDAGTGK